jgi:hypothetical protein
MHGLRRRRIRHGKLPSIVACLRRLEMRASRTGDRITERKSSSPRTLGYAWRASTEQVYVPAVMPSVRATIAASSPVPLRDAGVILRKQEFHFTGGALQRARPESIE